MKPYIIFNLLRIKVNGQYINNIQYADDTMLITDCTSDFQNILDRVCSKSKMYGPRMNVAKTKFMIVSRTKQAAIGPHVYLNQKIDRVKEFKYLHQAVTLIRVF
jgi:hypothetical protein